MMERLFRLGPDIYMQCINISPNISGPGYTAQMPPPKSDSSQS